MILSIKTYKTLSYLPFLILFLGIWIYFGFMGDYVLFFQERSSLFILSYDFLFEHLRRPGGILIYAGKFISSFYYFPLAGSFFISGILVLTTMVLSKIIFLLSGMRVRFIGILLAVALFYLQTDYHFLFHNQIGILIQLLAFLALICEGNKKRDWLPFAILPLVYFITGGFAWIFLLMATLYILSTNGKIKILRAVGLCIILAAIIFLLKELVIFQPGMELVTYPLLAGFTGSMLKPLLIISVLIGILPLALKIKLPLKFNLKETKYSQDLWASALTIIVLTLAGTHRYSVKTSQYFYIEKLFSQEKYAELISFNRLHPQTNTLSLFLNNIALSETNQLNDFLLDFPQSKDGNTLFLKWQLNEELLKRGGHFYYSIGMINEANRWAYENMVMKGYTPDGLKMLIRTELINGNYKIAAKYIGILKKSIFYKKEATKYEGLLTDDAVAQNKDLREKKNLRPSRDFFAITDSPLINVEHLLEGDSRNVKALNYKIAYMLLQKDIKGIIDMLPVFQKYGIHHLPLNVEEAIVAYNSLEPDHQIVSTGIMTDSSTEERWMKFRSIIRSYDSDLKRAEPQLKQQFGNTFWYYAFYR